MNKKIVVVLIFTSVALVFLAVVLYFLFLNTYLDSEEVSNDNYTKPVSVSPTVINTINPTREVVPSITEQPWEIFNYNFLDFKPEFSIQYPSGWETLIDYESSGGNDIRLIKDNRRIEIDSTGVPYEDTEDTLKSFVTNFNSTQFGYTVELLEEDLIKNDQFPKPVRYSIFKLTSTEDDSTNYAIVAQPYELSFGEGCLFIWDKSGKDLDLIKQMLDSITPIN